MRTDTWSGYVVFSACCLAVMSCLKFKTTVGKWQMATTMPTPAPERSMDDGAPEKGAAPHDSGLRNAVLQQLELIATGVRSLNLIHITSFFFHIYKLQIYIHT